MGNKIVVEEKYVRGQVKDQKKMIERCIRYIERQKRRAEDGEKMLKSEIKKMAQNNQFVVIINIYID
jgi:hypothetical protein